MCFEILPFCHKVQFGIANYHKVLQPSKQNTPRGLPIVLFSQLPEEPSSNQLKET